jgi:alkanesulfonate monooxygenase SsuD/methylene tetrahydromethanopterin reductase-like flavin-dependent oxidoreductase (luciferase family)
MVAILGGEVFSGVPVGPEPGGGWHDRAMTISLHLRVPHHLVHSPADHLGAFVRRAEESGINGLTVGDHVSFKGGQGYDGLIQATALAALSRRLQIWTAVYLLALRQPVTVARQVSSLAMLAPGRFVFGIGLGGDDPHELEVCGVDPKTRGKRLDACLDIVRPLLAGETVESTDPDLPIPGALIRPVPDPPVPLMIGGRSDAALRRAGRTGDGWLGLWQSAERVAASIGTVEASAAEFGRARLPRRYAYTVWCGLDHDRLTATQLVAEAMEGLYKQPFSSFERYSPAGSPAQVAAALRPYIDAGVEDFVLIGVASEDDALIDHAAEVKDLLDQA